MACPTQEHRGNHGGTALTRLCPSYESYPAAPLPAPAACRCPGTRRRPRPALRRPPRLCLAIRCRAPMSPSSVINSLKKRRDHSTGLPRRPSLTGTTIRLPRSGAKRLDQPVDQMRIDQRHVAEADHRAVGIFGHRRDAGLDRAGEPAGKIRIAHECHLQAGSACSTSLGLMAGDDDDARRPSRPAPARSRSAPAACRRVRPAACSGRPSGSSGRRRA